MPPAVSNNGYGIHTSYNIAQSQNGQTVNGWVDYTLNNSYGLSLGTNVTDISSNGCSQTNVSGNNLSLFISFDLPVTRELGSLNTSLPTASSSDSIYYFQKSGPGWSSVLGDLIVSVSSFSSVTAFASAFGFDISDVIAGFPGYSAASATALAPVFVVIVGAVAVDFIALYTPSQIEHYPSFYAEVGMSWPTGWLFFLHPNYLGAYGEEGLYSGDADTYGGTYLPYLVDGGAGNTFANGEVTHNGGPWNTFEEPPW
ncbi:hypothetical protein Thermo_00598 [Thermoplasmatales archaeon]|nr:hypothetical protein Thermo_00598 [Thermoplasmatales archaeon]